MTLTDDHDFGTEESVLPQGIYVYMWNMKALSLHAKAMANVKVFADKKRTDRPTNGRAKNYMPSDLPGGGGEVRKKTLEQQL